MANEHDSKRPNHSNKAVKNLEKKVEEGKRDLEERRAPDNSLVGGSNRGDPGEVNR
jgi:hypothetical protein